MSNTKSTVELGDLFLSKYKNKNKQPQNIELSKFQKPTKPTAPIIPTSGEYEVDLSFMDQFAKFNGGRKVILNLLHLESRFLYSWLLHNKSEAAQTLIDAIPTLQPKMTVLRADAGTEFVNKTLQQYLSSNNISLIVVNKSAKDVEESLSSYSQGPVERVNKTIRDLIMRALAVLDQSGSNKYRYEQVYDQIIAQYNNSPHSAFKSLEHGFYSPQEVLNAINDPVKYDDIYSALINRDMELINRKMELLQRNYKEYPIGVKVRALLPRSQFEKSSHAHFSDNIYTVTGHNGYRVLVADNDGKQQSKLYHEIRKVSGTITDKPVTKESSKEFKQLKQELNTEKKEKAENISKANIVTTKRERKSNVRLRDIM